MMNIIQHDVKQKHNTLYNRIAKAIQTGKFATYTAAKKQALYERLKRYENRLKRWGVAVASATALLFSPVAADAQFFVEQTGAANPLDTAYYYLALSSPTFVDIDNDGDFDCFSGSFAGSWMEDIFYFENTGTSTNPVFTGKAGVDNPFGGIDAWLLTSIDFVDIDNDGDFDAFIGEWGGNFHYYKNMGTASSPSFAQQTGGNNPLNGFSELAESFPRFVDIDNDGDFDCFTGTNVIRYFKNNGTSSSPSFSLQTGFNNPFEYVHWEAYGGNLYSWGAWRPAPAFWDIDNDGDFDAFIGDGDGEIHYLKNIGTSSSPSFLLPQNAADNPFNGVVMTSPDLYGSGDGGTATPTFVDIDGDGDLDAFIGEEYGNINFYKNVPSIVPVELVTFKGEATDNGNLLTWATATEENNAGFEVQKSTDARTFEKIGFVVGNGTTYEQQTYKFLDNNTNKGTTYYRLKQMDFDGQFDYSNIVSISDNKAAIAEMLLYPNPVKDFLAIENGEGTAIIYNALGQPLQQFNITDTKYLLNTDDLPKGIYTLQVRKADGTATVKQFVK